MHVYYSGSSYLLGHIHCNGTCWCRKAHQCDQLIFTHFSSNVPIQPKCRRQVVSLVIHQWCSCLAVIQNLKLVNGHWSSLEQPVTPLLMLTCVKHADHWIYSPCIWYLFRPEGNWAISAVNKQSIHKETGLENNKNQNFQWKERTVQKNEKNGKVGTPTYFQ